MNAAPHPAGSPMPPPTFAGRPRRLAVAALVLAILPVPLGWVPAFALAVVVVFLAGKGLEGGRGLAIAALVISSAWMVLAVIGTVVAAVLTEDPRSGEATASGPDDSGLSGDVRVGALEEGDCLANTIPNERVVHTVEVVPCSEEHVGEVFATFELPGTGPLRQRDIDRLSDGGCTRRFSTFVGMGYSESELELSWLSPLKDSIATDRWVTCIVEDPERTTGSLEGVER